MIEMIDIQGDHISPLSAKEPLYYTMEIIDDATQRIVHESARIWYVAKGKATFCLNDQCYEFKKGMCVSLFPWDVSIITKVEEAVELHIIVYRFSMVNRHLRILESYQDEAVPIFKKLKQTPVIHESGQVSTIDTLVKQIGNLQGCKSVYEKIEKESLFIQLLCTIVKEKSAETISYENSDATLILAVNVMQYMSQHFHEKLTLEYVAQQLFTNKTTISIILREVFSMTFVQLLSRMRLHKSIELLLMTNYTNDEIAKEVGYFDGAYFTKQFECKYNMSPATYRKKYAGGKTPPVEEIEGIIQYVSHHYSDEGISAHQIAKHYAISVAMLNTWMIFYTECTFDEWIHLLRMQYAMRLLRTTSHTILDIAITVGYTNTRTFQRVFEQHYHTTPAQYRKL